MVIGSGPIIIGQAAEFDYAGSQACRALQEDGIEVVLVNSNPATIMTDTNIKHAVHIGGLDFAVFSKQGRNLTDNDCFTHSSKYVEVLAQSSIPFRLEISFLFSFGTSIIIANFKFVLTS